MAAGWADSPGGKPSSLASCDQSVLAAGAGFFGAAGRGGAGGLTAGRGAALSGGVALGSAPRSEANEFQWSGLLIRGNYQIVRMVWPAQGIWPA